MALRRLKISAPVARNTVLTLAAVLLTSTAFAVRKPASLPSINPKPNTQESDDEVPGLPPELRAEDPAPRAPASQMPAPKEAPPPALTITKVVGEAGDQIITSREVQINDMLEQAVFGRLPGQTQIRALKGVEKGFPVEVQSVLREWIIYLEAKSFDSGDVSKVELQRNIKTAQDALSTQVNWQQLDPSASEISDIIERKLVAKRFLRLKTDSAQVPITDAEALAYYKKNRVKFGTLPFASFRENIKTFLIKQQMDRRLTEWLEVLERKYKVRNFIAG